MDNRDSRAVLGLPVDATKGEAQRAFRRLAKQTHPDVGGDPAAFRAVAGAWADLASVLPADRATEAVPPANRPWPALSPHARAYRPSPSRVVWAELRPSTAPAGARRTARVDGPDFATILKAEMARQAA
jgi:hypothetical protein